MKPFTKKFIIIFLQTGLIFGVLMALFDLINGDEFKIWKLLYNIIFFGFLMASFFAYSTKRTLKRKGITKLTNEILSVKQNTEIQSILSKNEIIDKLRTDSFFGKMKITKSENGILIKSNISLQSWGERIEIIDKNSQSELHTYLISSKPKLRTTLIDMGKNKENIDRIVGLIKNVA
jgi:hypothetical protein